MEDKRQHRRAPLRIKLDYRDATGRNFLYEYSQNISEGGIFIETDDPLPAGTRLVIRFTPPGAPEGLEVEGVVRWVNASRDGDEVLDPGMGVQFDGLDDETRDTLRRVVGAIAIMPEDAA